MKRLVSSHASQSQLASKAKGHQAPCALHGCPPFRGLIAVRRRLSSETGLCHTHADRRGSSRSLVRPLAACAGATAAAAGVAAAVAPAVAHSAPTQDPQVIFQAVLSPLTRLAAPLTAWLGGEGSWRHYLATRFAREVVGVVAAALLGYWLLTLIARGSVQPLTGKRPPGAVSSTSTSGGGGGGGEVLQAAADALTGPLGRSLLGAVLAINVLRNTTAIFDGFITRFNPTLPTDWLDDLVRLVVQSLTPLDQLLTKMSLVCMVLCGCAVAVRWKDALLAHYLLPHVEALDKGQELLQNYVNPASTLLNWVLITASVGWLATALGINLQPMLAVGGASGIIIGLATQQVLGNFVSGLNIFLARPFVAGEYINLVGYPQVSGRVIQMDPMRTLIATEDHATITVPNQLIAVSIVVNRSRTPHWSSGKPSPLLANPRELRWRMKLPNGALDRIQDLEDRLGAALAEALPGDKVRYSLSKLVIVKFVENGAEVTAKANLAWRLGGPAGATDPLERKDTQEELMQAAMLALQKVVRSFNGVLLSPA